MVQKVVVSRCDRLGDLVLSLPAANLVARAGLEVTLHCSAYARDIGLWGLANGLYSRLWVDGDPPPADVTRETPVLALYDSPATIGVMRALRSRRRFGPYSRATTYFRYSKGMRQHRSRVAKSEMAYNLDLVRGFLAWLGLEPPPFAPLSALKVPAEWQAPRPSPDWVAVLSSGGSARNWTVSDYLNWLAEHRRADDSLDFLVQGVDAEERLCALEASGVLQQPGVGLVENFDAVRDLIAYLAGAKQVLSSSTGPLHIAHAAGVPVYGLYPEEPRVESFARWKPDGYGHGAAVTLVPIVGAPITG